MYLAGAYLIACASSIGSIAENSEMMGEPVDKAIGGGFTILCYVFPDVERITPRSSGEAIGHQEGR